MLTKDTAICIRAVDYSETSQIVTFFTRANGKLAAIAKGSKRPKSAFEGPIEVFSFGQIVFSQARQRQLATLTEFEQRCIFAHLRKVFFTLNCSLLATELINSLTREFDPHTGLFDGFVEFLENIQDCPGDNQVLMFLILFQLTLLKETGLAPVLNMCTNCKSRYSASWRQVYFCSSAGGLICRNCHGSFTDRVELTRAAANCLAQLKLITEADKKTLREIEEVLIYHFTELLGKPPKMAKYVL